MYNKFSDDNICLQQPFADSQVDIFRKTVKWEELAPLPVRRNGHTAVLLGGVVLYVGEGAEGRSSSNYQHSCRLDVYNLTTNQWSPSPITTPYCLFAMTVLDDKLVIAGGATKNDEAVKKVFVLNAGQWKDYSEMPTARLCATAVGYHSMLIVVGGVIKVKGKWTVLSTTELLDTTNGCWYTCNNLPSPHKQMKAAIANNEVYLLGGFDKDHEPSPQVFVASLDTLSTHQLNWQSAPNTPWCASYPVVRYNKFLLIVGGKLQQSRTSEVYIFNPSTGQWKHLTNIPAARGAPAVVGVADSILVIGGVINENKYSNTMWIGVFE